MNPPLLCFMTVITLVVSAYLSSTCFNIVRRMRKETPWILAIVIIAIAALGAYAFLESLQAIALWIVAKYTVFYVHVSPGIAFATFLASVVLKLHPRIDVDGF
jgi:hypothetical protein